MYLTEILDIKVSTLQKTGREVSAMQKDKNPFKVHQNSSKFIHLGSFIASAKHGKFERIKHWLLTMKVSRAGTLRIRIRYLK